MGVPELTADGQDALAKILARHLFDVTKSTCRAPPLIELERGKKGQEIVTQAVVARHLEMLLDIFYVCPHAPPAKVSLVQPTEAALDTHTHSVGYNKYKWARDEAEKIHMTWRYCWGNYKRGPSSRGYALNRIKACFDCSDKKKSSGMLPFNKLGDVEDIPESDDENAPSAPEVMVVGSPPKRRLSQKPQRLNVCSNQRAEFVISHVQQVFAFAEKTNS